MNKLIYKIRSKKGQAAVGYMLVIAVLVIALGATLSSRRVKRALSILYTDMAIRVMTPGKIDSAEVHNRAVQMWGE